MGTIGAPARRLSVHRGRLLDDRPGPARDYLVQSERDWLDTIANGARTAVQEGDFRADLDCEQFAHDVFGVIYAYAHASRLMKNPKARERAQTAFETLVRAARRPSAPENAGTRRR